MRILVVEDGDKVSRFVVKGLTAERFAVDGARYGKSGWELAQTYQLPVKSRIRNEISCSFQNPLMRMD
jgi:DNA-binding response OmpR family regulator